MALWRSDNQKAGPRGHQPSLLTVLLLLARGPLYSSLLYTTLLSSNLLSPPFPPLRVFSIIPSPLFSTHSSFSSFLASFLFIDFPNLFSANHLFIIVLQSLSLLSLIPLYISSTSLIFPSSP